ncbi:MAG TPA: M20 family metallopeptidase [Candidatus Limnocylindrales bacterium]
MEIERLRDWLAAALPDYLADLERLVNIDCGSHLVGGVNQVGRWLAEQLRELGAEVEVVPGRELGDTVVGRLAGDGRRILLIGHMDTVFPAGTAAARPFRVEGDRGLGPGASDMKAGLLTGLYALRALRATGTPIAAEIVFIANPDEELASPESTPVIEHEARGAHAALVLEGARANGDIVSSRKGVADITVRLHGRAAHAGVEPEKGRNAIVEAAHKTLELSALNGRWPGVTLNVGVISGGTRPNVVPEEAMLHIDLRAVEPATMALAEAEIELICATTTVPDVSCVVEKGARFGPMVRSAGTARLAEQAIALAVRLGFELRDAATGGGSDAGTTSGLGVPTLDGLGPIGGLDHSPGEYVEIDSIVPRTALLAALIATEGG